MLFRITTKVGNETSKVMISMSDAMLIGGDNLEAVAKIIEQHGGSATVSLSSTMSIEVLKI